MGILECRQSVEIKTRGGEIKVDGREAGLWQRIWIGGGGRAVRSRKGISYSVFCTRNMNYITGKLRDISQMMLLLGEPRQSRVQGTRGEICQDP